MSTFGDKVKEKMGDSIPNWIPRGTDERYKKTYDHILLNLSDNFIDGEYPSLCDIKGNLMKGINITYNKATHMNSSQALCISFFKKFFSRSEYENILLNLLRASGIEISKSDTIEAASFEYVPNTKERTNFDFFIILESGMKISFEVKYTESEFGTPSTDKNWSSIYEGMVLSSPFIEVDKDEFYKNFQINRNIVYASKNDYVVFLTPLANQEAGIEAGRNYIDSFRNPHIKNLYWEELIEKTIDSVNDYPELKEYYEKFYDKYIKILI